MLARHLVLYCVVLASLGTACTAIVLGKVGDTGDYKTVSGGSSSSGSTLDECSLLRSTTYAGDRDANACSTCIENGCKSDIDYACNKGTSQKQWFQDMKDCAQKPWNGFSPPAEGSGFWECKKYATAKPPISDKGSDTQREVEAHNCINSKCLQGELPACKQCEVHVKKSGASAEEALLRDIRAESASSRAARPPSSSAATRPRWASSSRSARSRRTPRRRRHASRSERP